MILTEDIKSLIDNENSTGSTKFTFSQLNTEQINNAIEYILKREYKITELTIFHSYEGGFPESLLKLNSLVSLKMIAVSFIHFITDLSPLLNLEKLTISQCKLAYLPNSIEKLSKLQTLDLSANEIIEIPLSIAKLKNLISIDLSLNDLKHLPKNLIKVKVLKNLTLNNNDLEDFDNLDELENLISLDLSNNILQQIPISIFNLKLLERLNLGHNNITTIFNDINQLEALSVLDLTNNKLTRLPNSLGKLINLKVLKADANFIEKLPDTIGHLVNLEVLELGGNKINNLPYSIGRLNNLVNLELSGNNITQLPKSIGLLRNLQIFSLSNRFNPNYKLGHINQAITHLTNLRKLDLSGNSLNRFPNELGRLINLIELDLSQNRLITLPESIGNLINLKELNVSNNYLESIPSTIGNLSSLQFLDLQGNQIFDIPDAIGKLNNLQDFDLRRNRLQDLPLILTSLQRLKKLDYDIEFISENSLFKKYGLAQIALILQKEEKETIKVGLLRLPDSLKTAFQRYFVAFDDFWKDVTNKSIEFKVNKHTEGLEIEVILSSGVTADDVEERLNQYFSLLTINKDEFKKYIYEITQTNEHLNEKVIKAEVRVSQLEQDLRLAEFENRNIAQKAQNRLRNKQIEVIRLTDHLKLLSETKNEYFNLVKSALQPNEINISQSQNFSPVISINLSLDSIKDEFADLSKYVSNELQQDAKQLKDDLDAKPNIEDVKKDIVFKTRFRRFFKDLSKAENLKKWLENIKSINENTPKVYEQAKEGLKKLMEFSEKIEITETVENIKKILENLL